MRGIERRVTAAVALSLAFGMACSISLRDWQYFERSGSLVILVDIVVAWRDLVSLVGEVERLYEGVIGDLKSQLSATRPGGLIHGAMHDGVSKSLNDLSADFAALNDLLRKRIRTIEAIVLGIGTIVWGYGVPLGNFLWPF